MTLCPWLLFFVTISHDGISTSFKAQLSATFSLIFRVVGKEILIVSVISDEYNDSGV